MPIITRVVAALVTAAAFLLAAPIVPTSVSPAWAQRVQISEEFRIALEPYGEFQPHPRWGEVWVPTQVARGWRPYTVGHWVNSEDYGWYWVSDQSEADWGWITFHYGRWVVDRQLGWVWVPGRVWGPAFVNWRRGDSYIGWAPEPPDEIVVEIRDDPEYWAFVPAREFLAPRLVTVLVPPQERTILIERTVIENRTVIIRDRGFAVNPGISAAIVAAAVGQPIRTFQVRPVVVAGTANIAGATTVRTDELRQRRDVVARQAITVQQTNNVIQPAKSVAPPQPLAANAPGRLGDNPPRAARGATTGTGPTQMSSATQTAPSPQTPPPAAQKPGQPPAPSAQQPGQPPATSGQAPTQARPGAAPQTPPSAQKPAQPPAPSAQKPGQPPATSGQAPTQLKPGAAPQTPPTAQTPSQRPGTTGAAPPAPRATPQAPPREPAPPPAAKPQAPPQPPAARQERPQQQPAARAPTPPPQAPAARAPSPAPQAPAARAPAPQAPAAQAPHPQPPSTSGAAPRGPQPREEKR